MAAAAPALALGLIEIGGQVRFRHPLVRSACYGHANEYDRTEAHRALAEATDPVRDADCRASHRAPATVLPDEDVAAELVRCADRAREGRACRGDVLRTRDGADPGPYDAVRACIDGRRTADTRVAPVQGVRQARDQFQTAPSHGARRTVDDDTRLTRRTRT